MLTVIIPFDEEQKPETTVYSKVFQRAVRDTSKNVIPDQCNAFKKEMVSPLNLEGQYSSLGEISSSSVKLTKIPVKKRFVKAKKKLGLASISFDPDKNFIT